MLRGCRLVALAVAVPVLTLGASVAAFGSPGPGTIVRFAGDGKACLSAGCGSGGPATRARFNDPSGVATDGQGNVYIADGLNSVVWRVSPRGRITRFAGDEIPCSPVGSECGDGGPARAARLDTPVAVAVDRHGAVYIVDQAADEVREVAPSGTISRIAGDGRPCTSAPRCGDGGPAASARLNSPWGVAVDGDGDVYISDYLDDEIREVSPRGTISRLAGDASLCGPRRCGNGGAAIDARFYLPAGVAVGADGSVYVADSNDHEVRVVTPQGRVTRFAGNGRACSKTLACGDSGQAVRARIDTPFGVAVSASGSVYVTDLEHNDIRKVDSGGIISRVAGAGRRCAAVPRCGDGGRAADALLADPTGVAVDASGNVYVADSGDQVVRRFSDG